MIRISLGNVGSGKTVCEVREMFLNNHVNTYSNIITKMKHQKDIDGSMIITKELIGEKKKRDGKTEPIYKNKLNIEFWKKVKKPINIVLDEAHSILNARKSMSTVNIIVTDWIALIRRILGNTEGVGDLVLISQLPNRIDIIAREMANQIRYHVCHYTKVCKKCGSSWYESSETPEQLYRCWMCDSFELIKKDHVIELYFFQSIDAFEIWKNNNIKSYYKRYLITDIEKYFPLYNTLQWENLFSDVYI